MADDPLRELLSSPLEAAPRRVRAATGEAAPSSATAPSAGGWWLAASVLVGGLLTLGGYLVAADDPVPTTTTPATTTTTTTAVAAGPILPAGYTLVDDRLGMRVERVLVRLEEVLVTVSSVVPVGLEPTETAGFPGGRWDLVLADGRRITSTDEATDELTAQGFVSVRFPVTGIDAAAITGVELIGLGHRLSQVVTTGAEGVVLPADGAEVEVPLATTEFPLDDGVVLRIDRFAMSTAVGVLDWSLGDDDPDALGTTSSQLVLVADGDTQVSNARVDTGQFRFYLSFHANPLVREGRAYFDPETPSGFATPDTGAAATLSIAVSWVVFEPTRVSLDLSDALISTMEG